MGRDVQSGPTTGHSPQAILPIATLNFAAIVGLHRLFRCTYPQKVHNF